jgi:hypothetical protein
MIGDFYRSGEVFCTKKGILLYPKGRLCRLIIYLESNNISISLSVKIITVHRGFVWLLILPAKIGKMSTSH